jgi:hypothetical protein
MKVNIRITNLIFEGLTNYFDFGRMFRHKKANTGIKGKLLNKKIFLI